MVAAMLDASGVRAIAAGNIGRPLLDAVAADAEVIVAEVSSFQLAFAGEAFRPRVAVLLAITPDHLDWHGSFDDYAAAKARIVAHQTGDDLLVFDADDERAAAIAARAPARRVGVSGRADAAGCFRVVGDDLVFPDGRLLAPVAVMSRALAHDRTNALAAAAAALEVGATVDGIAAALRAYETMPHRVALVGEANGVQWYDDSKATNPDATRRGLVVRFRRVAGGRPEQGSRPLGARHRRLPSAWRRRVRRGRTRDRRGVRAIGNPRRVGCRHARGGRCRAPPGPARRRRVAVTGLRVVRRVRRLRRAATTLRARCTFR